MHTKELLLLDLALYETHQHGINKMFKNGVKTEQRSVYYLVEGCYIARQEIWPFGTNKTWRACCRSL